MAKEKVSLKELLKHEDFKNLLAEDNGAILKGYRPLIVDSAPNDEKLKLKQFYIARENDDSCTYWVENSQGTIKRGTIENAALRAELGSQYDVFISALKSKNSQALLPFMETLFNIQSKKGQPIDDAPTGSNKVSGPHGEVELYKDVGRGFYINGENFVDTYHERFKREWATPGGGDKVARETEADEIIKSQLQVDDVALNQFKKWYTQSIGSPAITPFMNLGGEFGSKKHWNTQLYKTEQGMIGARTEMNMEEIWDAVQGKVYNLQCQIHVDWEPNEQGELQFKSMRISGPDRKIVAKLFKDNDKAAFLTQVAKSEVSESVIIKETLIDLQKWIPLMEKSGSVPSSMQNYIQHVKAILEKDSPLRNALDPQSILDEIRNIALPVLTAEESADEKNNAFRTVFQNLYNAGDSVEFRKWSELRQEDMGKLTERKKMLLQDFIKEERKKMSPPNFIEKMSQHVNSKAILLAAAKMDKSIYQEIVNPKVTFSSVFRRLGEFFDPVKPHPKFTTQDHLAVIAKHPELLDGPKKNNPYWAIVQKASPEEKLTYLSADDLSWKEKLSLLSTYMTDPSKNPSLLGGEFFAALNEEILTALKGDDPDRYIIVRRHLDHWLLKGDLDNVKWLRSEGLKEAFDKFQEVFSDSPQSINYRLNMLMKENGLAENIERFGPQFLQNLDRDLSHLAKQGLNHASYNKADRKAIQSIGSMIHQNLHKHFEDFPGFQKIFMLSPSSSPVVTYEKLESLLNNKLSMSKDELVVFLKQLNKELLTLARKGFGHPSYAQEEKEAIQLIRDIVREDPKIEYSQSSSTPMPYGDLLTGFKAISRQGESLTGFKATSNSSVGPQAEHLIEGLAEAQLRIKGELEATSQKIALAATPILSSPNVPVHVESPTHPSQGMKNV